MRGKNLAIISRSGGHAVVAADSSELSGFELAQLPGSFLEEIEKHFRASVIKVTNPVDLGDLFDLDVYAQIIEQTLKLDNVDGVVFLHTATEPEIETSRKLLERVMELTRRHDKPIAYYVSTSAQEVNYLRETYAYPIFTAVVETIRALEISYQHYSRRQEIRSAEPTPVFNVNQAAVHRLITHAREEKRDLLLSESMQVLEYYGIPTAVGVRASNKEEARQASEQMGYPVAIKVISEQISHKSDVGGVQLNLRNGPAVEEAFDDMLSRISLSYPQAMIDGVLVQPMVTGGQELILGGRQDPNFGPVVLIGLGGIFVEVLDEVSLRVAPITHQEAKEMIDELRGASILKGARGHKPSDLQAVSEALLRLSQLLIDFPEIQELDINPLRVFQENNGCRALDARIMLG
jgi:acetyltransferase